MAENESEANGFDVSTVINDSVLRNLEEDPWKIIGESLQLRTDDNYKGFDNNCGETW